MYKHLRYIVYLAIGITIVACSTKKNTPIRRGYHNLTSRYNILFNGRESFKKGMQKLETAVDENYTALLPLFVFKDDVALAQIESEMERTIKKATKLISMHSITVKPKAKPDKQLSQKQKEFYNQKEFNKWVDEAYLLLGKAHLYLINQRSAKETFEFIVSNYNENNSVFEAKIWLARLAILDGNFRNADDILSSLSNNISLPKKLKGEFYSTQAEYYLQQEEYAEAIDPLEKSIEHTRNRHIRTRQTYLLAQLHAQTNNSLAASENFKNVIRMNPPYEMAFNAKINRALSYHSGAGSRKDIEKQLRKMLKDDKNIEFRDQIYFALGNLSYKNNEIEKTIEYYLLSMEASTDNIRQKAKTSLALADIYYSQPDYINAQAYYDSTVSNIDPDYPNYQIIYAKSMSLTNLVTHYNTVQFEDSVLALSMMSESELAGMIEELIEKQRQLDEEQRQREFELAEEQSVMSGMEFSSVNTSGSNWYFYNPTAKNVGQKEFIRIWGNRKLEDDWRRKNKSTINYTEISDMEEAPEDDTLRKMPGKIVTNKYTPDFYLQYIPFTDSAKEEANSRIELGLYTMGVIYTDELQDYPRALKSFEDLLRRYPENGKRLQVYYKLYTIAKETEDKSRVGIYQQKIISEFPESNYAKLMTNPNYLKELRDQKMEVYDDYNATYNLFQAGQYSQVAFRLEKIMAEYADHELYPKFDYLYTISAGIQKDTLEFVKDLQKIIAKYPKTGMAENAQIMVTYLQNRKPQIIEKQRMEIAKQLYQKSDSVSHYFAFITPAATNLNQLIFNTISFNLYNFDELKLEVKKVALNKNNNLCVVEIFPEMEDARIYLSKITLDKDIFRDVNPQGITPIVISETNYRALMKSKNTQQYLLFYRENYK